MKRFALALFTLLLIPAFTFSQTLLEKKTFIGPELKKIILTTSGGDIKIESWQKNEVEVSLFLTDKSSRKQAEFEEKYTRSYKMENGVVTVEVKQKTKSKWNIFGGWNSVGHEFKVFVPAAFAIKSTTSGGDVSIYGINGIVNATTSGGDFDLQDISGIVEISTSGGDIKLDEVSGTIKASTSGGDIMTKRTGGKLSLSTSGGDIDVDADGAEVDASTSGGDVKVNVNTKCEGLDVSTSGGDISIKIPKTTAAELDLRTSGGGVRLSDNLEQNFKSSGKVKKDKIQGSLNGGGVDIKANTSGGSIRVDGK